MRKICISRIFTLWAQHMQLKLPGQVVEFLYSYCVSEPEHPRFTECTF